MGLCGTGDGTLDGVWKPWVGPPVLVAFHIMIALPQCGVEGETLSCFW